MRSTLESAIATFGELAETRLANLATEGQPEDQFRAPREGLVKDLAEACGIPHYQKRGWDANGIPPSGAEAAFGATHSLADEAIKPSIGPVRPEAVV